MPAVRKVLVVGAGIAGAAAAIRLATGGVAVDLIDALPEAGATGSGITLQGNALRVLRELGVWDRLRPRGHGFDSLGIRAPDAYGTLLAEMTDFRTGGADLPATFGTYRPVLAQLLLERAARVGARVRFGTSFTAIRPDGDGVEVTLTDHRTARYDVVIGADGVRSAVRREIGIDLVTRDVGIDIWRVVTARPASVHRTELILGGPLHIAGYCPTGPESMYVYLAETPQHRGPLSPAESLAVVRSLAAPLHGPWDEIEFDDPARIHFTRFQTHLLDGPWNRGRVVVIGDAAHAAPPTLAQGAAMSLEDAAVLGDLLLTAPVVDDALWTEFTARRLARVRTVVGASLQMCQWLLDGVRGDVPGLHAEVAALVSQPA
ncbi:2-polyprenyl-6-methoxyphenol hydroxylase-like FAD-dependent oxidoreductase [Actinoplanes octamycinicus]|uniref:2-polyprenyl-6-methoxyphenol hydroxylase-like FAD-dependent oxidoreductase n=1 Tax=Actinoplanes octamycinicus TaxID=135948 RepID=A0A7W7GYJ8_9ACTN|nr:FAD-dependent monooxygenase [Actinoplanes octamycinicus]MBB4740623.1 2-polyprenyl-6-methoxyphenol hydroxylase-like FAD-dependent oxidoreductase [Actinoplanes octamycinicus]GIE63074.1 FAD-dependent oxidoreductase [Actinoplanes octamycinicus]